MTGRNIIQHTLCLPVNEITGGGRAQRVDQVQQLTRTTWVNHLWFVCTRNHKHSSTSLSTSQNNPCPANLLFVSHVRKQSK